MVVHQLNNIARNIVWEFSPQKQNPREYVEMKYEDQNNDRRIII
jgi:hypothetical protein